MIENHITSKVRILVFKLIAKETVLKILSQSIIGNALVITES
jgi:hypothetical protein